MLFCSKQISFSKCLFFASGEKNMLILTSGLICLGHKVRGRYQEMENALTEK